MKLCKDCRHMQVSQHSRDPLEYATCAHPATETRRVSFVDGIERVTFRTSDVSTGSDSRPYAEFVRHEYSYCGHDGKLFEAREEEKVAA